MKRLVPLLMALVMVLSLLAGCGQTDANTDQDPQLDDATPKEISIGFTYDASTLDVHKMGDDSSFELATLVGEGLVRNDNGTIVPGVAEYWDISSDNLTYTFHLRDNAMWSDGSPLTAYDFEYSYLRLLDPNGAYYNAWRGYIFANGAAYSTGAVSAEDVGVKALDERTLEITLEQASVETLYNLACYMFFPVHQATVEACGETYGAEAENVLTNGAFTLNEWVHEDRNVLVKNENYWNKDAVQMDQITRRVGIQEDTAVDMFQVGELDVYNFSSVTKAASLQDLGNASMSYVATYQYAHMNSNGSSAEAKRFMENTNFRKALNYAINREALTLSVYLGMEPATRLTAPTTMGVSKAFNEEYPYEAWSAAGDPDKAKECLELALNELNASVEDIPELSLLCMDAQSNLTALQAVQDMFLTTLGVKSKIDAQPIQQMLEKANSGAWDLWLGGKGVGTMDWLSSGSFGNDYNGNNASRTNGYVNDRYTGLYAQAQAALDVKERKDLMFEMEKILCEDPGSILLGWRQNWIVYNPNLSGIGVSNTIVDYSFAGFNN